VVELQVSLTVPAGVNVNAGQHIRLDANGKWALATCDVAANCQNSYLATKTVKAGMPLTGLKKGALDLGSALDALAMNAIVYGAAAAGGLDTAAAAVSKVVGYVEPTWAATTPLKRLRVDLT